MDNVVQRVACKAVIVRDGKVLLLREASTYDEGTVTGKWMCPGGRIEPGEPFLEGFRREVREETGLEVTVQNSLHISEWFPDIHGQKHQIVAIFFTCTSPNGAVTLSNEHDAYKWVSEAEAFALDLPDSDRIAIGKLFAVPAVA